MSAPFAQSRRVGVRSALTAMLRACARDRVIRKRLPADLGNGPIFCSPDALLSTWKPGWRGEQAFQLFDWARRYVRPGDTVWDIGANQGLFAFAALAASAPTGRVVAFEPDPFLTGLLHRSRAAQLASRLDILPLAVAGDTGITEFSLASKDRALNHLSTFKGNPRTGGERDRLSVVTVTLAWLSEHLPVPGLIKIDVEGVELDVLQNAGEGLLCGVRPRWIVEVASENQVGVGELFRSARYRLFDANRPHQEVTWPAWNTLALPAETVP